MSFIEFPLFFSSAGGWKRNHWWLIGSGHPDLPEVSTSRCMCFLWQDPVEDVVAMRCNADSRRSQLHINARRHSNRHSCPSWSTIRTGARQLLVLAGRTQQRDWLIRCFPWVTFRRCTRSEEHPHEVNQRSATPGELRAWVRPQVASKNGWHGCLLIIKSFLFDHLSTQCQDPADFRCLCQVSRMAGAIHIYPSYAYSYIGRTGRTCLFLFGLCMVCMYVTAVRHLCDSCTGLSHFLQLCFR